MSILDIFRRKPIVPQATMERFEKAFEAHDKSHTALQSSVENLQRSVAVNQIVKQEETKTIRKIANESGASAACKACAFCAFFKPDANNCTSGMCTHFLYRGVVSSDFSCRFFKSAVTANGKAAC